MLDAMERIRSSLSINLSIRDEDKFFLLADSMSLAFASRSILILFSIDSAIKKIALFLLSFDIFANP